MTLRNMFFQKSLTQKRAQRTSRMVKKEPPPQRTRRVGRKGWTAQLRREPATATPAQRATARPWRSRPQTPAPRRARRRNSQAQLLCLCYEVLFDFRACSAAVVPSLPLSVVSKGYRGLMTRQVISVAMQRGL